MSSKLNIRTGDTVMVITGDNMNDAGKTGKVIKVYPAAQRAVVAGRNMIVRHVRRAAGSARKAQFMCPTLCSYAPTASSPPASATLSLKRTASRSRFASARSAARTSTE